MVYSNCDDPFESNFFRYFVLNFNRLGLKRLISTSYKTSPVSNTQITLFGDDVTLEPVKGRPKIVTNKFIINEVSDVDGDGSFTLEDILKQLRANKNNEWTPLEGDGDFRSDECVELLKQSDIVVTNPPFSLFREYITQLFEHKKKFLIIGNLNAITYKEIFPMIKGNKVWLGPSISGGDREFVVPHYIFKEIGNWRTDEKGVHYARVPVRWFTNLDHGHRHQPIPLMTEADVIKFLTNKAFEEYQNYDAVEVSFLKNIPSDFVGTMGVPISFLDKYNPDQFEIVGMCENEDLYKQKTKFYTSGECKQAYLDKFGRKGVYDLNASGVVIRDGLREKVYKRLLIKHKKK